MASRWAKTHNWPEAQGVVADKLRLSWVLQRRRGPAPPHSEARVAGMTWLSLALFGFVVILTIAWRVGRDGPVAEPDRGFDDEAAMRAAVELHLFCGGLTSPGCGLEAVTRRQCCDVVYDRNSTQKARIRNEPGSRWSG